MGARCVAGSRSHNPGVRRPRARRRVGSGSVAAREDDTTPWQSHRTALRGGRQGHVDVAVVGNSHRLPGCRCPEGTAEDRHAEANQGGFDLDADARAGPPPGLSRDHGSSSNDAVRGRVRLAQPVAATGHADSARLARGPVGAHRRAVSCIAIHQARHDAGKGAIQHGQPGPDGVWRDCRGRIGRRHPVRAARGQRCGRPCARGPCHAHRHSSRR